MYKTSASQQNDWENKKKKLLKKFSFLDENDVSFRSGNREEMMEKLQIKLCVSKEDLEKLLSSI